MSTKILQNKNTNNIVHEHAAYSYNNKCKKCAGMGLNGFIFEKININCAENMKKSVGAV